MNTVIGTWNLTMKTPVGSIDAVMTFEQDAHGVTGSASGKGESVALTDIATESVGEAQRVTWNQRITKPMRLNLAFDVMVNGDQMSGVSRAGRLPSSKVTGYRRR